MDDLTMLAQHLSSALGDGAWRPAEARALLRAGRALAREQGYPGLFDQLLADHIQIRPHAA